MANRNPNNWHWTEKNCLPWAKDYFGRELAGVEVKGTGDCSNVSVKTVEITACEGDVDLNQRKGKIITLFDLKLSLKWTGTTNGITARGTIDIPEVAHDTEVEDYVFDITVEGETRELAPIKDTVRKELAATLRKKLAEFAPALINAHAKDVQYDQDAATPSPKLTPTPKPAAAIANIPAADTSKPKQLNTTTLTESVEFVAPAHDVYEVFLDPLKVKAWTRSDAQVSRDLGSAFSLFDGNITGKVLNLEYDKKIVQTWRLKSWPKDHYSTVTMTITPGRESVTLNLKQEGVPVGELESVRQNWKNYYWQNIKSTFGFGATF